MLPRTIALLLCAVLAVACDSGKNVTGAPLANAGSPAPDTAHEVPVEARTVTVYKSATCGCCVKWAEHLERNGFTVVLHDTEALGLIKDQHGVPAAMQSCHTATVGDYVIEGHVPAEDIEQLLTAQPEQRILAVPGMPLGSPGMEHPHRSTPYDSLLVGEDGDVTVFARH